MARLPTRKEPDPGRVPVLNLAELPPAGFDLLAAEVGQHTTLGRVLEWARTRNPPRSIVQIVTQDEFTHDVVLASEGGCYLVYDTT